jgi:RNA polymerase sigma-70 factor (ECF subfamily)
VNEANADNEIRARLAAGDVSALDMIWAAYASDMLGYLVSMLCSRHDAEDVLQEVFITIARKRSQVAEAHHLKSYLFRLARNTALNRIKKSKRRRERETKAAEWLVPAEESHAGDDRTREIESALAALPEKQRTVVVFKFFRDKTFREIGELLAISENTAASRYRYAMAKLKDLMSEIAG